MYCYNCGCELTEHDFCTNCGADVSLYKKIMQVSNMYYNEGLEKAGVRDLSGAVVSLRQSLKFNKNNVEARNLLGLVYYEMGESVAALSEWVISKNLRPEKNIADDYINSVQSSASKLDNINQTVRKYNQAYNYCVQGSKDLAIIQLKKVLSLNPKLVQAHLLLALLYIDSEQWERARREVSNCLEIDRNNTTALRYQKEIDRVLSGDDTLAPRHKSEDSVRYQSDNEVIIQPTNQKQVRRGVRLSAFFYIAAGIVVGVAAVYFLVVPARVSKVNDEANMKIAEIGNQLDVKSSDINALENQLSQLEISYDSLNEELESYVGAGGTLSNIDSLIEVAAGYLEGKSARETADELTALTQDIEIDDMSDACRNLYYNLTAIIGPDVAVSYYEDGMAAYDEGDYVTAISDLSNAVLYDETHIDALFYLGNAYRENGDAEEAVDVYNRVIELFPGSQSARRSQNYINQLTVE